MTIPTEPPIEKTTFEELRGFPVLNALHLKKEVLNTDKIIQIVSVGIVNAEGTVVQFKDKEDGIFYLKHKDEKQCRKMGGAHAATVAEAQVMSIIADDPDLEEGMAEFSLAICDRKTIEKSGYSGTYHLIEEVSREDELGEDKVLVLVTRGLGDTILSATSEEKLDTLLNTALPIQLKLAQVAKLSAGDLKMDTFRFDSNINKYRMLDLGGAKVIKDPRELFQSVGNNMVRLVRSFVFREDIDLYNRDNFIGSDFEASVKQFWPKKFDIRTRLSLQFLQMKAVREGNYNLESFENTLSIYAKRMYKLRNLTEAERESGYSILDNQIEKGLTGTETLTVWTLIHLIDSEIHPSKRLAKYKKYKDQIIDWYGELDGVSQIIGEELGQIEEGDSKIQDLLENQKEKQSLAGLLWIYSKYRESHEHLAEQMRRIIMNFQGIEDDGEGEYGVWHDNFWRIVFSIDRNCMNIHLDSVSRFDIKDLGEGEDGRYRVVIPSTHI